MNFLLPHLEQINALCRRYRVERLYVFGSVLTDQFDRDKKSDLDFLVAMDPDMEPLERGEMILQFWNALELLFERPVDLLTEASLKNPFLFREIERTRILLYDERRQEILV